MRCSRNPQGLDGCAATVSMLAATTEDGKNRNLHFRCIIGILPAFREIATSLGFSIKSWQRPVAESFVRA